MTWYGCFISFVSGRMLCWNKELSIFCRTSHFNAMSVFVSNWEKIKCRRVESWKKPPAGFCSTSWTCIFFQPRTKNVRLWRGFRLAASDRGWKENLGGPAREVKQGILQLKLRSLAPGPSKLFSVINCRFHYDFFTFWFCSGAVAQSIESFIVPVLCYSIDVGSNPSAVV